MKMKAVLIIVALEIAAVCSEYCPNGYHPHTNGLSCVHFHTIEPLNYSAAMLAVQNGGSSLAIARNPRDLRTLSAYHVTLAAAMNKSSQNVAPSPLWVSCEGHDCLEGCNSDELDMRNSTCRCPVLLKKAVKLVNCSLELGYIVQISYEIQNISAVYQDSVYAQPNRFVLEIPNPFNYPAIRWTYNDKPLNSTLLNSADNSSLHFEKFTREQVGIYKAFTSNGFNQALVFTVNLKQAVFEIPQPKNVTIPTGHLAVFKCASPNSRPVPQMNWFNGDLDPITSGERYLISPLGTLYIREVVPSDSGMYYCRLNNSAGEAMVGARLQVINETINENELEAQFIQSPSNQTFLEDETATLECTVASNHVISSKQIDVVTNYLFEVDGSFINTVVYLPYFIPDVFPSVAYRSDGSVAVRCQAQITVSSLGTISVTSEYAWITPNGKHNYIVRAAITSITPSTSVSLGEPVLLSCSYTGLPAPIGWWYFNGQPYFNGTSDNGTLSTVYIEKFSLHDVGTYECVAVNSHSIAAKPVLLTPKDGKPSTVAFIARLVNSTDIIVTWNPPAVTNTLSPVLIWYFVKWHIGGSNRKDDEANVTLPYSKFSFTIRGLKKGQNYMVGVAALSKREQSPIMYQNILIPGLPRTTVLSVSPSSTSLVTSKSSRSFTTTTRMAASSSISVSILPSIGAVNPRSSSSSMSTVVLSVVLSSAVVVIFAIVACFIGQCVWWRNKGTFGNYSPAKIEEQCQREVMLSVESQPVTPPPPLTPPADGSTHVRSFVPSNSCSSDVHSELSVEVVRVDLMYSSKDELCS